MNLQQIVSELIADRDRLNRAIDALTEIADSDKVQPIVIERTGKREQILSSIDDPPVGPISKP